MWCIDEISFTFRNTHKPTDNQFTLEKVKCRSSCLKEWKPNKKQNSKIFAFTRVRSQKSKKKRNYKIHK